MYVRAHFAMRGKCGRDSPDEGVWGYMFKFAVFQGIKEAQWKMQP